MIDELIELDLPICKIIPKGDKISRLIQVLSYFENKQVVIYRNDSWQIELQNELMGFPQVKHDDQVDSITQFLHWYKNRTRSQIQVF